MHRRTLPRLLEVGRSLAGELDLDPLLERVLGVARELTGARFATVGVMDAGGATLDRFITSGDGAGARRPAPFLGVPILVRGESRGDISLYDKAEGAFTAEDEQAMVVLADWAAIAIANTRLYESVRDRRDELERAVRALETTTEIGGEVELDRILELIAERGRALVQARTLLVALLDGDGIRLVAAAGEHSADALGRREPIAGTVADAAVRSLGAERVGAQAVGGAMGRLDPPDARSGLVVPLVFRGRALGVLAAFDRTGAPDFTVDDERLVEAFAATAAIAVATAQQIESRSLERSIRASEAERRYWARELHDDTLQELAAMRLRLAAAQRASPEDSRVIIAEVMESTTAAIRNLRDLITDLRPAALDDIGATAALEALGERIAGTGGLVLAMSLDLGDEHTRLAPELEVAIYRVVQEALTNVVKHAGAASVSVRVCAEDDDVQIRVSDDGSGFDVQSAADGFGLIGMHERVALVGGRLEISSTRGEGTTVSALLPAWPRGEPRQPVVSAA